MNPDRYDLFELWRLALGLVCTIYALVVTGQNLWEWIVYLSGRDRATVLVRQYVLVQLLRLRVRRFAGELAQIVFWLVALAVILRWHQV